LPGVTGFPPGSPTRCLAAWPSASRLRAACWPPRHEHHRGAVIAAAWALPGSAPPAPCPAAATPPSTAATVACSTSPLLTGDLS